MSEKDFRSKQEKNDLLTKLNEFEKKISDKLLENEYLSKELKQEQYKNKQIEQEFV